MVRVTDGQILAALAHAGRHGIFGEPAAMATVAGVRVAVESGLIGAGDRVLVINSGSGLKDAAAAIQAAGTPIRIKPSLDAVEEAIESATARE
jgi:threonine synthase